MQFQKGKSCIFFQKLFLVENCIISSHEDFEWLLEARTKVKDAVLKKFIKWLLLSHFNQKKCKPHLGQCSPAMHFKRSVWKPVNGFWRSHVPITTKHVPRERVVSPFSSQAAAAAVMCEPVVVCMALHAMMSRNSGRKRGQNGFRLQSPNITYSVWVYNFGAVYICNSILYSDNVWRKLKWTVNFGSCME